MEGWLQHPEGWSFRPFSSSSETVSFGRVSIDWKDTPAAHVFIADVPGLKKEEVKVEIVDGKILCISGERKRDLDEKTDTWRRVERSSGKFQRRFKLPENSKVGEVTAAMQDGVLTVTVPKEQPYNMPDLMSIPISG